MNSGPIVAAEIELDGAGTPRSRQYGDVYHPRGGAVEQARHVFLGGNELPGRWRGRDRFVVLETGFGLGTNFLATWRAWRDDPERSRKLHFVSIDASPPTRQMLAGLDRDRALLPLGAELVAQWPPLVWSLHRLVFDAGAVELLLAFGDVGAWLPQLTAEVDAFFLDGFAPAVNPTMWEPRLIKAMARLAAPGATVATWTVARSVRDGLHAAGFEVAIVAGSGAKREMTRARFAPRFTPRPVARRRLAPPGPGSIDRNDDDADSRIVIVGAGLAGCALAASLADADRSSLVLERCAAVAEQGSGNAGGLFHGVVHRGDGRHSRLHRVAAFAAGREVSDAIERGDVRGSTDGVVRVEPRADRRADLQATLDRLGWPVDYVRATSAAEASRLAGITLASPAWFFPSGGWVDPRALARSWLARAGARATLRTRTNVVAIERNARGWRLVDADGTTIATARVVVLANAGGAFELLGRPRWPIVAQRGQITSVATADLAPELRPQRPIAGLGHVLPDIDGETWFGASSRSNDDGAAVACDTDRRFNLARFAALTGVTIGPAARLGDRTALRWLCNDRLPIIGAVPAASLGGVEPLEGQRVRPIRLDQPRFASRAPGLFVFTALGSRGIAFASLGARILAAMLTGAPSPVEADLLDAVDPARFASRDFRRAARLRQPPVGPIDGSFVA